MQVENNQPNLIATQEDLIDIHPVVNQPAEIQMYRPRRICGNKNAHNFFKQCCGLKLAFVPEKDKPDVEALVPLQTVNFKGHIENGHATLNAQLTFVNNVRQKDDLMSAIECKLDLPCTSEMTVTSLFFTVGDKTIQAKIQDKQEAKERYDDAIA